MEWRRSGAQLRRSAQTDRDTEDRGQLRDQSASPPPTTSCRHLPHPPPVHICSSLRHLNPSSTFLPSHVLTLSIAVACSQLAVAAFVA